MIPPDPVPTAGGGSPPSNWPPPLHPRWYSYRAVWTGKEAAETPEVTHRGSMLRFCEADSSALEQAFR